MFAGHELKTPVTVMKAGLEMMRREGISSRYLDDVETENEKMSQLIRELLDDARLQYQQRQQPAERTDLSSLVEGVVLSFDAAAYEKNVILTSEIEENISISGYPSRLSRMTEALLENAIRHTDAGGQVRVRLERKGSAAEMSVSNQGKEIPVGEREKIFEKFYHSGEETEGGEAHYGLGLAIAQNIAELHGTQITVDSRDGLTSFRIRFHIF